MVGHQNTFLINFYRSILGWRFFATWAILLSLLHLGAAYYTFLIIQTHLGGEGAAVSQAMFKQYGLIYAEVIQTITVLVFVGALFAMIKYLAFPRLSKYWIVPFLLSIVVLLVFALTVAVDFSDFWHDFWLYQSLLAVSS
jgi:hypothetical protein